MTPFPTYCDFNISTGLWLVVMKLFQRPTWTIFFFSLMPKWTKLYILGDIAWQEPIWARFRRRSTRVPNLTDELSTAKERRLNQFGTAVLVWCGKSVKFDRVCRTFVELNLGSTHGTPSESDVAPVSLQSRTYSVRFGTWKVRRLNQALIS